MFVKLVGELLGRLGFVDVDYQGDGPEGGIDLFATELLPFTVQGRTPFRWAIQCKFSSDPRNKSVNDREVQDVEGILRSDRYLSQNAKGYLLVTNREIVQNVVERLRGIDRQSQYRTARLDGGQLESMLADHKELVRRYLDSGPSTGKGPPALIFVPIAVGSSGEKIGIPIEVRRFPNGGSARATAIVDTGSEVTIVPLPLLESIGAVQTGSVQVRSVASEVMELSEFVIGLAIEQVFLSPVRAFGMNTELVLLGRNALKAFTVLIDPTGTVTLFGPDAGSAANDTVPPTTDRR